MINDETIMVSSNLSMFIKLLERFCEKNKIDLEVQSSIYVTLNQIVTELQRRHCKLSAYHSLRRIVLLYLGDKETRNLFIQRIDSILEHEARAIHYSPHVKDEYNLNWSSIVRRIY